MKKYAQYQMINGQPVMVMNETMPFHLTFIGIVMISIIFVPYLPFGLVMRHSWKKNH